MAHSGAHKLREEASSRAHGPQEAIADRINGLSEWIANNAPNCAEQAHLDEGSSERAYWHYGYLQALRDVQALLNGHRRSLN